VAAQKNVDKPDKSIHKIIVIPQRELDRIERHVFHKNSAMQKKNHKFIIGTNQSVKNFNGIFTCWKIVPFI
jgi:hypothetical protein